ncbi:MAG: hypothetical protein IH944_04665 [Armatimonadetes bacterium]|nr:hypothetical protein [Armatimonadota bacterium]
MESDKVIEAREGIESTVKRYFVGVRGLRVRRRHYFKNLEGVQHSATLSISSWSPYFRIMYCATLLCDEDRDLKSYARVPDIEGDLGWLSGRKRGTLEIMDAAVEMPVLVRINKIQTLLEEDAEKWYSRVSTPEDLRATITESWDGSVKNYVPFAKGALKVGIDPWPEEKPEGI